MSKVAKPPINVLYANPTNRWSRNGQNIEYIVLHYVGAVSSAKANAVYLNRDGNLGWSAHFFTDEHSIWQPVPLDESAGHCGVDYSNGRAPFWGICRNKNSIGIEMCCKKDAYGNWYIEPETVKNTVALVKWLMAEFNIPIDRVVRHYDVCWKTCPEPWVRDPAQWQSFKKKLTEEEIDMAVEDVRKIVREEMEKIVYGDIKDVPDYWEGSLEKLLKLKVVDGGTPENVNDHDVNMNRVEAKMSAIMVRTIDTVFPGKIEEKIKEIQEGK